MAEAAGSYSGEHIYIKANISKPRRPAAPPPIFHPDALPPHHARLAAAPLQDTAHVVLVATTDLHGHVTDWDYVADRPFPAASRASHRGRLAPRPLSGASGARGRRRPAAGRPFATYFARVAPTEPHPIVEAMNLAGYDAATPGAHDFDWGLPLFRRAVTDARFPT